MFTNIQVINFGCRLNNYEGEIIKDAASGSLENMIIFNTCAVTKEAERQARQAIRRARKENPDAKIVVTGCSAQVNPLQYEEMPEVDKIIGNQEKLLANSYLNLSEERVMVNDIMSVKETALHLVGGFEGKARAFVQVQNGCNHRCTFCIIPYGRGNSRSVPVGEIVEQVRLLVSNGYNEIVLTGVDISDYGSNLPGNPTLGEMMKRLLKLVPELPRLRLSSIDVAEIDADIMDLLANEPRFMPYFHISLQAGDNLILKRMKRRHLREDAIKFTQIARKIRPDVVFGADIIAGFPTETEEMFKNSLRLVEEAELTYLHIFPYSERDGTPAVKMPQVPKEARKDRASRLKILGDKMLASFLESQIGKKQRLIVESDMMGRSEHFAMMKLLKQYEIGSIIEMVATETNGKILSYNNK